MDRRRPDLPSVDAPTPPGSKSRVVTTYDGVSFRRRASHQTVWELASERERKRLTSLSRPDLLAAVKASAITDLTEDDQTLVLEHLYPADAQDAPITPAPSRVGQRKPMPLAGKGLPFGPRIVRNRRRQRILVLAITAPVAWALVLLLGYALAQGGWI